MKKILIIGVIMVLIGTSFFSGCVETEAKGILRLQITDKPGDLEIIAANVNISMVQVHKSGYNEDEVEKYENFDEFDDDFETFIVNGHFEGLVDEDITFEGYFVNTGLVEIETPVWYWKFGDGSTSNDEDQTIHAYSNPGLFTINLTIENKTGVKDWYIAPVSIKEDGEDDSDSGWLTVFEGPVIYDLIEIQDENVLLGEEILNEGKYTQIRLTINSANITIKNEGGLKDYNLKIPSNKIKLINPFLIYEEKITVLTLDFDVNESVHKTGNEKYMMRPVIKVIHEYLE